ncbi:MAG: hypothetical protein ACJA1A_001445 [Saprospiraceae bacterium]|jgi:hypothetical protein
MDDIYGKIRDKMNDPSEVKTTDQDWGNFLKHRQSKDGGSSNKVIWPFWAAVASLLLLLGVSNIYWMTKDSNTNSIMATNIESVDTIYITKYVENSNSTSTIDQDAQLENLTNNIASITYQYQNLRSRLNNQSVKLIQLQSYNNGLESKYTILQNRLNNNKTTSSGLEDLGKSNGTKNSSVLGNELEERILLNIIGQLPTLKHRNIDYHSKAILHPSSIIVIKNERPFNLLDAMTPKSFSINANVAYAFNPSIDSYDGLAWDIRATTLFSNSLRGFAGFTILSSQARLSDDHISNPNVPFPMIPEGDNIEHSDEKLSELSINVGLEYLLNPNGRWRPFAGLGYGRVVRNSAKYSFEIETATGNEYYIAPEENFLLGNYNQLMLSIGTDINLYNRLDMRLDLNYTYALQDAYNSSFLLKAGAYFHF